MLIEQVLYITAIIVLIVLAVMLLKIIGLISKLKETLEEVDQNLRGIHGLLVKVTENLEPVMASSQKTLDEVTQLSVHLQKLVEEATALPPAVKEILGTFSDIFKELADDLRLTIEKVNSLLDESTKRVSGEVAEVLKEVDKLVAHIDEVVLDIQQKVAKTNELFRAVEETGKTTKTIAEIISKNVAEAAVEVAAVAKGLQASLKIFRNRLLPGGGNYA